MPEISSFDKTKYGVVFNIQNYSVHDGPGIRTIVFLKGCPLSCQWCSNPESQQVGPELACNKNNCTGTHECTRCLEACKHGDIFEDENKKMTIDRQRCTECFVCAEACPAKALNIFGNLMSVNEVLAVVEQVSLFYSSSDGGLTLSGGEPTLQIDFAVAILKEARRRRINTAIETCGHTEWGNLEKVCQHLNSILFDIKCIDEEKHKKFKNVSNELILSNFTKMCEQFPDLPILVRNPVIPGFNDSEEDILALLNFIKGRKNVSYELLPYHRLGQPKYDYLGRDYLLTVVKPDDEKINLFNEIVKANRPE